MKISENFEWREFEQSPTANAHKFINAVTTSQVRDSIKALVHNVLQPLRNAWGEPLKVNSGYRNSQLNALIGGVPKSQHTKGEAADIDAPNPYKLAILAKQLGLPFDQMILYPTFVHFSHRLNGEQRGDILYSKTYKGKRL